MCNSISMAFIRLLCPFLKGIIQAVKTAEMDPSKGQCFSVTKYAVRSIMETGGSGRQQLREYSEVDLIGPGFQTTAGLTLQSGQKVYVTFTGREVAGYVTKHRPDVDEVHITLQVSNSVIIKYLFIHLHIRDMCQNSSVESPLRGRDGRGAYMETFQSWCFWKGFCVPINERVKQLRGLRIWYFQSRPWRHHISFFWFYWSRRERPTAGPVGNYWELIYFSSSARQNNLGPTHCHQVVAASRDEKLDPFFIQIYFLAVGLLCFWWPQQTGIWCVMQPWCHTHTHTPQQTSLFLIFFASDSAAANKTPNVGHFYLWPLSFFSLVRTNDVCAAESPTPGSQTGVYLCRVRVCEETNELRIRYS